MYFFLRSSCAFAFDCKRSQWNSCPRASTGLTPQQRSVLRLKALQTNSAAAKTNLKLVTPSKENRTVMPLRRPNADLRPHEHLTEREVDKLMQAARGNRWGQRDATMILIAFRHGLRASEVCGLQWSDVGFEVGHNAPAESEGWGDGNAPAPGRRIAGAASIEAGNQVAVYIRFRARCAVLDLGLGQADRAGGHRGKDAVEGASAHAAARHRLRTCEHGNRHPNLTGLPGAPEHSINSALHRTGFRAFQEFMAHLDAPSSD